MKEQLVLASSYNRPTKTMRVISLSKLARIFVPYTDISPYLDDPDLWRRQDEPFDIKIETSMATQVIRTQEPHLMDESLTQFFVGIDNTRFSKEYAYTGLVFFDVPEHLWAAMEFHKKTGRSLPLDIKQEMDAHVLKLRELSEGRVIQHCKNLYNSMVAGRNKLKENGKVPEDPNDMELLLAYVLRDEIRRSREKRAKLRQLWNDASAEIGEAASV